MANKNDNLEPRTNLISMGIDFALCRICNHCVPFYAIVHTHKSSKNYVTINYFTLYKGDANHQGGKSALNYVIRK